MNCLPEFYAYLLLEEKAAKGWRIYHKSTFTLPFLSVCLRNLGRHMGPACSVLAIVSELRQSSSART